MTKDLEMSDPELWILEVAATTKGFEAGWVPFWPLVNDDPGNFLNFVPHRLPYDILLNELLRLFAHGDLIAGRFEDHRSPVHVFVPSREEIEAALLHGRTSSWLCFTLTPQGLARWERYAEPDWSCYATAVNGGLGELVYATAGRLDVVQKWVWYLCEELNHSETVQWDRAIYQIVRPWRILPYKTLEQGVQIIVPTAVVEPKPFDPNVDWCAKEREVERLMEGIDPWYRHSVKAWGADHESRDPLV